MPYTVLYVNDIIIKILNTKEKRWNLKGGSQKTWIQSVTWLLLNVDS